MTKLIISILGKDRPGIIAAVTRILADMQLNIEDVSQTILQSEFCGLFIVTGPDRLDRNSVQDALQTATSHLGMGFHIQEMEQASAEIPSCACEPFVITTRGPDRIGLVASVTAVLAAHNVNVTQLEALFRGGDAPERNIMIYEVDVPLDADQGRLRRDLLSKADELGLEISIQHKNIFEAINRI